MLLVGNKRVERTCRVSALNECIEKRGGDEKKKGTRKLRSPEQRGGKWKRHKEN